MSEAGFSALKASGDFGFASRLPFAITPVDVLKSGTGEPIPVPLGEIPAPLG